MGIEPTSEAWEAYCRHAETHKLAAFCRFSKFSNGFQLEQAESPRISAALLPWPEPTGTNGTTKINSEHCRPSCFLRFGRAAGVENSPTLLSPEI
jgi:hypothetical protein